MNSLRILSLITLIAFSAHADAGKTAPTYKGRPLVYWMEQLQRAPSDAAQLEAANAVAAFGADADSAVSKLVELLNDRSPEYRSMIAYQILHPIAKDAKSVVPAIIKFFDEKPARDPEMVLSILGNAGPKAKEAVPQLKNLLKHEKAEIRLAAAEVLWAAAKNPDVVPVLEILMKEEKTFVGAVNLLGEMGPEAKAALPALRKQCMVARPGFGGIANPEAVIEAAIKKIEKKQENGD